MSQGLRLGQKALTVAEQFLDIKQTTIEVNFNVTDFPSFATRLATFQGKQIIYNEEDELQENDLEFLQSVQLLEPPEELVQADTSTVERMIYSSPLMEIFKLRGTLLLS